MTKWIYILFLIFSFLILLPFLKNPNIINGNDLNGNIVPLLHFKESLIKDHTFPLWNSYIDQGIPTVADPLYDVYNPIIGIPILLFDYQTAVKVMYLLTTFLACISMYLLAKTCKVSENISFIIGLTYGCSSYLASRIVAGHLEYVIPFGLLPFFVLSLLKVIKEPKILWSGIVAITISLIFFSGDIYNALYCLCTTGAVLIYYLFKNRKIALQFFFSILLFILFSSIKILPLIELQNYITKIKEPFMGSVGILTFTTNLFFPYRGILSKIAPGVDLLSTGFPWWESLVFIGPISILGVYFLIKSIFKKHSDEISILLLLNLLFLLIATPGSVFNPVHYLISRISLLQLFHVPSRIFLLWGITILLALAIFLDSWKNKTLVIILLLFNLFLVFFFTQNIFKSNDFGKIYNGYEDSIKWVAKNNPNNYYTVHATAQNQIPQDKAYLYKLLLLQSNYGLFLKGSLAEKYNFKTSNPYTDLKPGFVLTTTPISNSSLRLIKTFHDNVLLYYDTSATPFAQLDKKPQKITFGANSITTYTNSKTDGILTLLETKYPGWNVFMDGKKQNLEPDRFLSVKTESGKHVYKFTFFPISFILGLLISSFSFFVWGFYIFNNRNIVRKKRF